jgi:hypothetical protein
MQQDEAPRLRKSAGSLFTLRYTLPTTVYADRSSVPVEYVRYGTHSVTYSGEIPYRSKNK